MPALSLKSLDVDALLALRSQVENQLASRRSNLEKQLVRMQGASTITHRNGRASVLKGVKVKPKYRDAKTGEIWAGRGVYPRWLAAALKSGRKLEEFLIDKSARKLVRRGGKRR
jgi:DNA-binding protein H-NS